MHKINLQAENCCTEKKNGRPRPEFCPDCCLSGRSSKLTFSFIGLSTGIWICPNAKVAILYVFLIPSYGIVHGISRDHSCMNCHAVSLSLCFNLSTLNFKSYLDILL